MKVHGAVLIRNTFRQLYTNHTHRGQQMTKVIGSGQDTTLIEKSLLTWHFYKGIHLINAVELLMFQFLKAILKEM